MTIPPEDVEIIFRGSRWPTDSYCHLKSHLATAFCDLSENPGGKIGEKSTFLWHPGAKAEAQILSFHYHVQTTWFALQINLASSPVRGLTPARWERLSLNVPLWWWILLLSLLDIAEEVRELWKNMFTTHQHSTPTVNEVNTGGWRLEYRKVEGKGNKTQEAGGGWEQAKDESVSRRLLDGG